MPRKSGSRRYGKQRTRQVLRPQALAGQSPSVQRRSTYPEEFKADMAALFKLLREGAIHPIVIDRLPLTAASEVHARIDSGGLGGKIVLLPCSS